MLNSRQLLRIAHSQAIEKRGHMPYSVDFIPYVTFMFRDGHKIMQELRFRNQDEKTYVTMLVTMTATISKPEMVFFSSHLRHLNNDAVRKEFNLTDAVTFPHDMAILHKLFDGIENMPRHLFSESIMTTVKGPSIQQSLITTPYSAGEDGVVQFQDEDEIVIEGPDCFFDFPLIPDWWKPQSQQSSSIN
jgi:hypothetical protein